MTLPDQPRLRRVESFPIGQPGGETSFALRDPEGFSAPIALAYPAAVLASLMDGSRTLEDIQQAFLQQLGQRVSLDELGLLIEQLDDRYFLDTPRFRARWKSEVERYLNLHVRPAAHAGGAYAADPDALRQQLADLFTSPRGPGAVVDPLPAPPANLGGLLSPHIDFQRGGTAFAWAYKRMVEESAADLFVVLGTAHNPMGNLFSASKKHFETPLGTVETDRHFVARLAAKLSAQPAGPEMNLYADELAHRQEHSIEFQTVFLQYLLGERRAFKIVPVLVGSFHEFVAQAKSPGESPQVQAFVTALRQAAAEHQGRVCYITSGDLAHIGRRYGDSALLATSRLQEQAASDQQLLAALGQADPEAFFNQIAQDRDRSRICGLSPTYTMLKVLEPKRGEILRYDQAVELDRTACVSFASMAFY